MLHELRSGLRTIVSSSELATVILTPTVHMAIKGQRHAKPVTDGHLKRLTLDLLDAMWGQEFAEGACSPQEQTPRIV